MSKHYEHLLDQAMDHYDPELDPQEFLTEVFDSWDRAPWWFPVTAGYRFGDGEPIRFEAGNRAEESIAVGLFTVPPKGTYFLDTRWTPPVTVTDVLKRADELKRLPDGSLLVDKFNRGWQKSGNLFIQAGKEGASSPENTVIYEPFTVVWIPEADSIEEQDK